MSKDVMTVHLRKMPEGEQELFEIAKFALKALPMEHDVYTTGEHADNCAKCKTTEILNSRFSKYLLKKMCEL